MGWDEAGNGGDQTQQSGQTDLRGPQYLDHQRRWEQADSQDSDSAIHQGQRRRSETALRGDYYRVGASDEPDEPEETTDKPTPTATAKPDKAPEEEKPPADLVVSSKRANPNTYTGEVTFDVELQNTGGQTATDVRARFVVVGPDGKTWISKTLYHGPIKPGGRWTFTEEYKHRLGGQAVTDRDGRTFEITVTPEFKSKKD